MNITSRRIALAMLVAAAELASVAYAQAARAPVTPVIQAATQPALAVTEAPVPTKAPEDWII